MEHLKNLVRVRSKSRKVYPLGLLFNLRKLVWEGCLQNRTYERRWHEIKQIGCICIRHCSPLTMVLIIIEVTESAKSMQDMTDGLLPILKSDIMFSWHVTLFPHPTLWTVHGKAE
jgi:hypothetical protein